MSRQLLALAFLLCSCAWTSRGGAEEPSSHGFRPSFRRFGVWDYVGTAAISGAYYAVELTQRGPRGADWTAPLPLDRPFRDWVVADTKGGREQADGWSDRLWYASVAYPVLDALVTPAIRSRGVEISAQMTLMNFQSFMLVSLLIRMPHKWIGRLRPDALGCANDPTYTDHCGNNGLYVSFPGGHVAVSMTGAGLSCAHHLHARLYGSPWADGTACGAALGAASLVGYFRLRADKHWLSDQLAGTMLGLLSGYLVPTLLYYHPFWRSSPPATPAVNARSRARWSLLPWLSQDTLGGAFVLVD
jgi:membrane-associated phospholipid phosphatase